MFYRSYRNVLPILPGCTTHHTMMYYPSRRTFLLIRMYYHVIRTSYLSYEYVQPSYHYVQPYYKDVLPILTGCTTNLIRIYYHPNSIQYHLIWMHYPLSYQGVLPILTVSGGCTAIFPGYTIHFIRMNYHLIMMYYPS